MAARVTFEVLDVTAPGDITSISVSGNALISRPEEMIDGVFERPAYATWERDYFKLDGSFMLPPTADESEYEVGWYGSTFSGPDGSFATAQIAALSLSSPHSSVGLTVSFDVGAGEYPTDFSIEFYDAVDNLLDYENVTGNTGPVYTFERQITGYTQVYVIINKWCRSDRRAKITEISFGIIRVYGDGELITLSTIEQIDPIAASVPAGELKFTVDNSSREFNILNPVGIYAFLQQRQLVKVEFGLEVSPGNFEYIPAGYYYLWDWKSDEGTFTASFTARDVIDFIPDVDIQNTTPGNTNLGALAAAILTGAGFDDFEIDPALNAIPTSGAYNATKIKTVLQMIAIAGCAVTSVSRDGHPIIKQLAPGASVDVIDFDNAYAEPEINLADIVSRVEVSYFTGLTKAGTYVKEGSLAGGKTIKVENTLINTAARAQAVAEWIMTESEMRANFNANWRGNPAQQAGDLIDLEDRFGNFKQARVLKIENIYAGFLKARTNARGAI